MSSTKWSNALKGIRVRLTLVYSTLFGLFICIFSFIITTQHIESGRDDFDSALLNYAIDLADQVQVDRSNFQTGIKVPKNEKKKHFPFALGQTIFDVRSIEGGVLTRSQVDFPLKQIPYLKDLALKPDYTHRFQSLTDEHGIPYRAINLKLTNDEGRVLILQVATPSGILDAQAKRHFLINILTIPFLILVSSIASYLIAGHALTSVKGLTQTAKSIVANNLSLRVPEVDTGDEMGELSRTLNNLLERLEKSFQGQEKFVANASHQLNTPLSIIKGELDVLESKPRTPEDIARFHKSLREELERLIELVKNMLLVSRVEAGQESFEFHQVRLDEILLATSSRLTHKAKEKGITLRFNVSESMDTMTIKGERQLLDSLFENLLDNAIKYSPENSTIQIRILPSETTVEVQIQDEGPGIGNEELSKILGRRFQRGSTMIPGTGIGLSIAYQIAQFHKAEIVYKHLTSQGSLFSIRFPK